MERQILDLNQGELEWVSNNLTAVKGIIQSTISKDDPEWLQPTFLDGAYKIWYSNHDRKSEDPNPMINAFGIAFGQYLVEKRDFEWKVITDQHGAELAVRGMPGEIVLFPTNLVAKRYEKGLVDFFVPLSEEIIVKIDEIRTQLTA